MKVEEFIATIRDSFIGSQQVYTRGSCYHFYLILKEVFSEAECYYDQNHVITKIDNKFYDIKGEISQEHTAEKLEKAPSYNLKLPFNIYTDAEIK